MKVKTHAWASIIVGLLTLISAYADEGLAKKEGFTESDADPAELKLGIETEMEHTNDQDHAKQIALDHLSEDPHYYTKLLKIGL